MSFLKIKVPSKRDKLVAEYLKTKNKIQENFRSERLGEQSLYEDFGKIFKPITKQQQKSSEEIVSKFAPLQEAIENMPAQQALPWDMSQPELEEQPEALPAPDDKPPPENYGPVATKYLRKFATDEADKRYGLKNRNDQWYLGNSKVDIVDNNIKIGDTEYQGTEGLWHLLMMDKPDKNLSEVKIIKTVEKCW